MAEATRKPEFRNKFITNADSGNLDGVRECLLDPDCDVNARDKYGQTAVMLAARQAERGADSTHIMRELLAHERIEVNQRAA